MRTYRIGDPNSVVYQEVCIATDDELRHSFSSLTQHQLKRLRKIAGEVITSKYDMGRERKIPKYGNLPKNFTMSQLESFFASIKHEGPRIAFTIQFLLGLRIGELNGLEIVEGQGLVKIQNNKCSRTDFLPIIPVVEQLIRQYQEGIQYSPDYLRKVFRQTVIDADMNYSYGTSDDNKKLHQFSTHSLRHTAINLFSEFIGDQYRACCFSRHSANSQFGAQASYRHYSLDEMRTDYEECFGEIAKNLSMIQNTVPLTLSNHINKKLLQTMECLGFSDHTEAVMYVFSQFQQVSMDGLLHPTPIESKLVLLTEDMKAHNHKTERQTFLHYLVILMELEDLNDL